MRKAIICLVIVLFNLGLQEVQAQEERTAEKIEQLELQKEQIRQEEKQALKNEVENINSRLESGKITRDEADRLKEEAAEKRALNIRNRISIIDNKISILSRNEETSDDWEYDDEVEEEVSTISFFDDGKVLDISGYKKEIKYDRRTYTDLVFAVGFNNALQEGQSLNDSDFKIAGSRFVELGLAWKTRVFENSNWLRFKYGFSFQFNGLKPTDNRYFVEEDDLTVLEEHPLNLDKSKFRMDNLVVPLHFEFGPSSKTETEEKIRYSTRGKLKIGLGGYAGFNLGERQKLKFEEDGDRVKEKLKGDYNTNEFIYGLSGYIGWGESALYVKYDLNPIFKDPNTELNNISVGLRFDVD